jgi:hypothetical protein
MVKNSTSNTDKTDRPIASPSPVKGKPAVRWPSAATSGGGAYSTFTGLDDEPAMAPVSDLPEPFIPPEA